MYVQYAAEGHGLAGSPRAGIAALRRTGEKFTYQADPIPGLKHLDLHDGKSFTLVPDSMAQHLVTADVAAVPLTDSDLPTFNLELVWRKEGLAPATALVVSAADALSRGQRWIS
ncbi:hypothetical protein [Saccharopolyspora shandongensis]|uniref:hypothetical protein n=1 Tax=Saccharopolyspora shandongensis TaxID=418495 RepID=UPI0033D3DD6E